MLFVIFKDIFDKKLCLIGKCMIGIYFWREDKESLFLVFLLKIILEDLDNKKEIKIVGKNWKRGNIYY